MAIGAREFIDKLLVEKYSGQQVDNITNLTQEAIRKAQQATQQGGSGGGNQSSGSGGGGSSTGGAGNGGNSTNKGTCTVNDGTNSLDRLYYLQQLVKESNTLQKFLLILNNNPFLKSIQKDGRNSPFVKTLLASNPAIGPLIDSLQQNINDLLSFEEIIAKKDSPEELKEFLLQKTSNVISAVGDLDSLYKISTRNLDAGIPSEISVALSAFDVWIKSSLLSLAENEFKTKYPDAYNEAWAHTTPIAGFVGYNELGVYVPASAYQDQVEQREYWIEMAVRTNNPELYDKIQFSKIELETSKSARNLSIFGMILEQVRHPAVKVAGKALGVAIPC